MKKLLTTAFGIAVALLLLSPASALAWYFNPSGTGFVGAISVYEYIDLIGTSFISLPGDGTFGEHSTFNAVAIDGGPTYPGPNEATGVLVSNGVLTGPNSFAYLGGSLDFYADAASNYGGSTPFAPPIYGANDGTPIGTFQLVSGGGALLNGVPNGTLTVSFVAQSLVAGYWFDNLGNDLSLWTLAHPENLPLLTVALATTNASTIGNVNPTILSEYAEFFGGQYPTGIFLSNDGQFRISVIPEPASMLLLGLGFGGLAVVRRKRRG